MNRVLLDSGDVMSRAEKILQQAGLCLLCFFLKRRDNHLVAHLTKRTLSSQNLGVHSIFQHDEDVNPFNMLSRQVGLKSDIDFLIVDN